MLHRATIMPRREKVVRMYEFEYEYWYVVSRMRKRSTRKPGPRTSGPGGVSPGAHRSVSQPEGGNLLSFMKLNVDVNTMTLAAVNLTTYICICIIYIMVNFNLHHVHVHVHRALHIQIHPHEGSPGLRNSAVPPRTRAAASPSAHPPS